MMVVATLVAVVLLPAQADNVVARASESVALVATGLSTGTAFVVDDGKMVTNAHVVAGSSSARVEFPNGDIRECEVASNARSVDLALLECDTGGHEPLALDTSRPELASRVVAIGYPGGSGPVATAGIVSAVAAPPEGWLRTDAPLNPGNSGGPVVNEAGRVVGVATAIDTVETDAGYAVPSEVVRAFVEGDDIPDIDVEGPRSGPGLPRQNDADDGGTDWAPFAVVGGALVLVVLYGLFARRRRLRLEGREVGDVVLYGVNDQQPVRLHSGHTEDEPRE